jgi:hypothetical protein
MVNTRIGTRIGEKDEACIQTHADTVGHGTVLDKDDG